MHPRGMQRGVILSNTIAIIFAGGVGMRMGHPTLPKQLMEVAGKPILIHTLERFQEHKRIDSVYLVVGETQLITVSGLVEEYKLSKVVRIVAGGDSAHSSIYNGLKAAVADGIVGDAVVLIHDGVRPIVSEALITTNIKSVLEFGSGITSVPAYETVGISRDGSTIESVPERSEMYALQAPQSFRLERIYGVNERAEAEGKIGSFVDQAHMMDHYNEKVHLIEGIRGNVKITVPADYKYFTFLHQNGDYQQMIKGTG